MPTVYSLLPTPYCQITATWYKMRMKSFISTTKKTSLSIPIVLAGCMPWTS